METKNKQLETIKANEKKWGKPLMDAGWTVIPSTIIERQKVLGLDPLDLNILLHLLSYWWYDDNKPHPSKKTIAAACGRSPRTIQLRIAEMEKHGLIRREERRIRGKGSATNIYHLEGLIKLATPYAHEKTEEISERKEAHKKRVARKGRARLRIVS